MPVCILSYPRIGWRSTPYPLVMASLDITSFGLRGFDNLPLMVCALAVGCAWGGMSAVVQRPAFVYWSMSSRMDASASDARPTNLPLLSTTIQKVPVLPDMRTKSLLVRAECTILPSTLLVSGSATHTCVPDSSTVSSFCQ